MTLTIPTLRTWAPEILDTVADQLHTLQQQLTDSRSDLDLTVRALDHGWEGDASEAATNVIRRQAVIADDLIDILQMARRAVHAAADTIAASKALIVQAEGIAHANNLRLTADDVEIIDPEPTDAQRDAWGDARVMVQAALRAARDADTDAAKALRAALTAGELTAEEEAALLDDIGVTEPPLGGSYADSNAAWWASLGPAAQAVLERTRPMLIGNLDGVPYDVRMRVNKTNILNAEATARVHERDLEDRLAALEAQLYALDNPAYPNNDFDQEYSQRDSVRDEITTVKAELADVRKHLAMYGHLLNDDLVIIGPDGSPVPQHGHQVVLFDPDNSRFAEIIGKLGPDTQNIGVYVGGTGSNVLNMIGPGSQYDRVFNFVAAADPPASLAMLSYLGGPMPQALIEAPDNSYAANQGGDLERFVNYLDETYKQPVTVVAHSYGGSVAGAAEVAGMHADRIVHVESAGAGPGVHSVNDYSHPDTPRYTMLAPDDPIAYFQGASVGDVGHGASPLDLHDVVRLETGWTDGADRTGPPVTGHSDVFKPGTTAFNNILGVMTGGDVTLHEDPGFVQVMVDGQPHLQWYDPNMDPSHQPPIMDVP